MTFEIINTVTTNTLACYATEDEARAVVERFRISDPKFGDSLVVVAFDQDGQASEGDAIDEKPSAQVVETYPPRGTVLS